MQRNYIIHYAVAELLTRNFSEHIKHEYEKMLANIFMGANYDISHLSNFVIEIDNKFTVRVYEYV